MELEKQNKAAKPDKRQAGTPGLTELNQPETGANKMADATVNNLDATVNNLADTAGDFTRGLTETAGHAQSAGKKMTDRTVGMFDQWSDIYNRVFRFDGTRRLAEVYIETSEKIAHETLDFSRKYLELSASSARKFWQVAAEQLREGQQNR
jgi:hypothetical protein